MKPKISRLKKCNLPELQQIATALGISVADRNRLHLITAIASTDPAIAKAQLSPDQHKSLCSPRPRKPPTPGAPLTGLQRSQYRPVSATVSTATLGQLRGYYPHLSSQAIARMAIAEYLDYLASNPPLAIPCDRPGTQITIALTTDTLAQINQHLNPGQSRSNFVHQAIARCFSKYTDSFE